MMTADDILDYEALVAQYDTSLQAVLRHHQGAGDLDAWVPDDDPLKSVVNMVEAAELVGKPSLALRLGPATLAALDVDALLAELRELGDARAERSGDAVIVRIERIGGATASAPRTASADIFGAVGPAYREGVRAAAGTISHEGDLHVLEGAQGYAATVSGTTLEIAVDPAHRIVGAAFSGSGDRAMRATLDVLCRILLGLTVQEARDHAVIRFERALRDESAAPAVAGITLPQNADPIFLEPLDLVRAVARRYTEETGYAPGWNFFTERPSEPWLKKDEAARKEAIAAQIPAAAAEAELAADDARVVRVEKVNRATIAFREGVPAERHGRFLLALERLIHAHVDRTVQVFSIELKDANVLRRL